MLKLVKKLWRDYKPGWRLGRTFEHPHYSGFIVVTGYALDWWGERRTGSYWVQRYDKHGNKTFTERMPPERLKRKYMIEVPIYVKPLLR